MRPRGPVRTIPPPLELECLKALWQLGHGSVRDVMEFLRDRKLAYTTVMTVLDRLEKRKAVTRQKQGRAFIYAPEWTRDELRRHAVKDLVDTFFDGSHGALLEYVRAWPAEITERAAAGPGASPDSSGTEPVLPE